MEAAYAHVDADDDRINPSVCAHPSSAIVSQQFACPLALAAPVQAVAVALRDMFCDQRSGIDFPHFGEMKISRRNGLSPTTFKVFDPHTPCMLLIRAPAKEIRNAGLKVWRGSQLFAATD